MEEVGGASAQRGWRALSVCVEGAPTSEGGRCCAELSTETCDGPAWAGEQPASQCGQPGGTQGAGPVSLSWGQFLGGSAGPALGTLRGARRESQWDRGAALGDKHGQLWLRVTLQLGIQSPPYSSWPGGGEKEHSPASFCSLCRPGQVLLPLAAFLFSSVCVMG